MGERLRLLLLLKIFDKIFDEILKFNLKKISTKILTMKIDLSNDLGLFTKDMRADHIFSGFARHNSYNWKKYALKLKLV
jgi:hypothetical protein